MPVRATKVIRGKSNGVHNEVVPVIQDRWLIEGAAPKLNAAVAVKKECLSNTLDSNLCIEELEEALSKGTPKGFNTDQGRQFTGEAFTGLLEQHGVRISPDECGTFGMDGKGRYADKLLLERLWRSVKHEEV